MPYGPIPPNARASVQIQESVSPALQPAVDVAQGGDKATGTSTRFIWSCTEWEESGESPIVMFINPSQVAWTIPFRRTQSNVHGGTTFQEWKSPDGSSVDLPRLRVVMNTGRIFPITYFSGEVHAQTGSDNQSVVRVQPLTPTEKISVFYRFCRLTSSRAFTRLGNPNLVSLQYKTLVFPKIDMIVKFTEPLSFTEEARSPFNLEYSIGLTVISMSPQLGALIDVLPGLTPRRSI